MTTANSQSFTLFGRKVKPSVAINNMRLGWEYSIVPSFDAYTQIKGENIEVRNSMLISS